MKRVIVSCLMSLMAIVLVMLLSSSDYSLNDAKRPIENDSPVFKGWNHETANETTLGVNKVSSTGAGAVTLFGLTQTRKLVKFDTNDLSNVTVVALLTGLPPTMNTHGRLAWDPQTPNTLYALGHRTDFGPYWLLQINIATGATNPQFILEGSGMSGLTYVDNPIVTGLVAGRSRWPSNWELDLYHLGVDGSMSLLVSPSIDNNVLAWDAQNDVLHSFGVQWGGGLATFWTVGLADRSQSILWTKDTPDSGAMTYSPIDDNIYLVITTNELWRIDTMNGGAPVSAVSLGFVAGDSIVGLASVDVTLEVPVDVKPRRCPNPINTKTKGALAVAILGTDEFDVTQIDVSTIRLEGVEPIRWSLEDVATPFEPFIGKESALDCTEDGPDGYNDLVLRFQTKKIINALGDVADGDVRVLKLSGNLLEEFGGNPIKGEDVVVKLKN